MGALNCLTDRSDQAIIPKAHLESCTKKSGTNYLKKNHNAITAKFQVISCDSHQ